MPLESSSVDIDSDNVRESWLSPSFSVPFSFSVIFVLSSTRPMWFLLGDGAGVDCCPTFGTSSDLFAEDCVGFGVIVTDALDCNCSFIYPAADVGVEFLAELPFPGLQTTP